MSRNRQAKQLADRINISYTDALARLAAERRARAVYPHPLDGYAPKVTDLEWIQEVTVFAEYLTRFLDAVSRKARYAPIDSEMIIDALDDEMADDALCTEYLAAVHDFYCTELKEYDLWWDDAVPYEDLVFPLWNRLGGTVKLALGYP